METSRHSQNLILGIKAREVSDLSQDHSAHADTNTRDERNGEQKRQIKRYLFRAMIREKGAKQDINMEQETG